MPKITDLYDDDRPREKIAKKGVGTLSNRELISAILGRGVSGRDVTKISADIEKILDKTGGDPSYKELLEVTGMGMAKAAQIVAVFELSRRYMEEDSKVVKISCPEDVLPVVEDIRSKQQEYFICITLNGACEVIKRHTISKGLLNQSLVHPREVFADAIVERCASVILVHNHPSGNLKPSQADLDVTKRLCNSGNILGIEVLDHVIVTKKGWVSLKKEGLMPESV